MRELAGSGYMSNRGRQNVASLLAKDLAQDWRTGGQLAPAAGARCWRLLLASPAAAAVTWCRHAARPPVGLGCS
jgi:hypothetical protein